MRFRTTHFTSAQSGVPRSTEIVVLALLVGIAIWLVYSFAQEVYLNHRLTAEASAMQQQNRALESENAGYRKDIAAVASGASAEEDSRVNGYARGDEKVYVVGAPPIPSPAAQQAKVTASGSSPIDGIKEWLRDRWSK